MKSKDLFVEVILPLAIETALTYSVPEQLQNNIAIGMRVEVPLKNKHYSGIISNIIFEKPAYKIKEIASLIDKKPIIYPYQIDFWIWIADYYCCSLGEVMNVSLPAGLKLNSETIIHINQAVDYMALELKDDEYILAEAISLQESLTISTAQEILDKKNVLKELYALLEHNLIFIKEELKNSIKIKKKYEVRLHPNLWNDQLVFIQSLDLCRRSENQQQVLLKIYDCHKKNKFLIDKELIELLGINRQVLKTLFQRNYIIYVEYEENFDKLSQGEHQASELSPIQVNAFHDIKKIFEDKKPVLLHGVTGSGKTRIYTELINEELKKGNQVLYLLPEIALTSQMIRRLNDEFQSKFLVYHSKKTHRERVDIWSKVYEGYPLILGARSSLFLPFRQLSLIVVDEEHDSSYKQSDPAPRYHGRDLAVVLAHRIGAKILLGSATPSLESFYNVEQKKYGLVKMHERYGVAQLPEVQLIDMKKMTEHKEVSGAFSNYLLDEIKKNVSLNQQVILFQNRRGFAPIVHCAVCGWKAMCVHCDVSLTLHSWHKELKCHYCNYHVPQVQSCPSCGNKVLVQEGIGTQYIEEELLRVFPELKVKRMDNDTTRSKSQLEEILEHFQSGEAQVLVGTQMVTKGFDFDRLMLVAILNVDLLLSFPNFRAEERAFQLINQVAGRAGRRDKIGKVLIQSYQPNNHQLKRILHHDINIFVTEQLAQRQLHSFPPYIKLIDIIFKHKSLEIVRAAAQYAFIQWSKQFGNRVFGPFDPVIIRIQNLYIQQITFKIEKNRALLFNIKNSIRTTKAEILNKKNWSVVRINIDVDPD